MKSSTQLDSAVFQLTPTRTRCDLLVWANGKAEKIASGLLKPFLAHLKTAQDQVAKGGYSIILIPEGVNDVIWFTKGTIERFVRFVSTPEVLERVYTIESEILQIKEAIAIQTNNDMALTVMEENLQAKKAESVQGSVPLLESNEEKAIVLYQPSSHPQQTNGSTVPEENSKVQVLRVLETRKTVLQKEQGMAFARAVAAGFDMDDMVPLISFAKSFGASRLMDACVKFMDLWKKKHESGQWVEIETMEVMSIQPEISAMNNSGIVLANAAENNGKTILDSSLDTKSPVDNKPNVHQEYLQGQYPQPIYPQWPIHSPPGAFPVFQGYPMQGMPYFPGYPGNSPFTSPYQSVEDPRYSAGQRKARKQCSTESEGSESEDKNPAKARPGGRRKSGKVVIRNINYISSKKHDDSETESDAGSHEEGGTQGQLSDKERATEGAEADNGHWEAFQTYLLQDADRDDEHNVDYMMEKEVLGKKRHSAAQYDPLVYDGRDRKQHQEGNATDMQNGNVTRRMKGSNDESFISRKHGQSGDGRIYGEMDLQYREVDGKRVLCRRNENDDFMIRQQENGSGSSSDPLTLSGFGYSSNSSNKRSLYNMDDSHIVPVRAATLDEAGINKRNGIDIGSEIPSPRPHNENARMQVNYEPHDLRLMPERGAEKLSHGYDPLLDFGLQDCAGGTSSVNKKNGAAGGAKKLAKDPKLRLSSDAADKRKTSGPIRKGRPTKLSPSDEARARAEKLRNFKADLMKMKKEKEEEERKRIEALKVARRKRIAARSNTTVDQLQLPSQQTRQQLPAKLSPGAHRGSKFSDSEPGSTSPLQRFPIRTASLGSNGSQKLSKNGKSRTGGNSTGSRLTRSLSSLSQTKKENNTALDAKSSISRIRRLSEPKTKSRAPSSSVRSRGPIGLKRLPDAPESKKISAIVNHDKTKIASLPELKIKASKSPVSALGKAERVTENRSSVSEVEPSMSKEKPLIQNNVDESPVIEKTVVTLECEKPSIPTLPVSVESVRLYHGHHNKLETHNKSEVVFEHATVRAPMSSEAVDKEPIENTHENASANDIVLVRLENLSDMVAETPKFPASQSVTERAYQAPYARTSSVEDPCMQNSDYIQAPPTSMHTSEVEEETVKVLVSESRVTKLEKITEASDKSQTKESASKGLRKLLKFGRKAYTSASGEHNKESDNAAVNSYEGQESAIDTAATSSEAFTLKNLISQDEAPTTMAAPQKSSRHFSLLSPFKSKATDKKVTP